MESPVFSLEFEVRFHEVGSSGLASMKTLWNYLQSTGYEHSRSLGTSLEDLREDGLAWVYARFRFHVDRYPALHERVRVETWRSWCREYSSFREYSLVGADGQRAGYGTATLALIDVKLRRTVKIPDAIRSQFSEGAKSFFGASEGRVPDAGSYGDGVIFPVRTDDIDLNGHVNNTSYLQWMVEALPMSGLGGYRLGEAEVEFLSEVRYGESVASASVEAEVSPGREFLHRLATEGGEKIRARGRTRWEKEAQ